MSREFDIVIVGAGSSGAVVAARASEDPNRSVLLLEAGPDYPDLATTPFDLRNGYNNSYREHDWGGEYVATHGGRTLPFTRGRVVGGSSAVNTAIALRGVPEDYDEWAALGNREWSWQRVLPFFKRLERDLDFADKPYHGDAGPISIRRNPPAELSAVQQAFIAGALEAGYPFSTDGNAPEEWGVGPHPMNRLGRVRISTAVAYLAPARIRQNLEIRAHTLVRRVLIERGRCAGVEVENPHGAVERIAAKLVVLSAGAVMTPALLMRSGLGPRPQLEAAGVDVLRDVPGVGQNLSDHPAISVVCVAKDAELVSPKLPLIQSVLRFTAEGSSQRNDLQIQPLTFAPMKREQPAFAVAAVLQQQYGRGELRLRSADARVAPVLEHHFCEDERDASRLAWAFRRTLELVQRGPLAQLTEAVLFPDPKRSLDDAELVRLCRRSSASGFHACGTAKMGPASDPSAVVDQHGRCHMLENLVVADASIMPGVPRANTNLTCIMIGERIGEWLRSEPALYGLSA